MIRKMEEADLDQVCAIERETFSMPWTRDNFYSSISKINNIYLIMEEEGIIKGYCGLWGIAGEGQITNVAVKKEYRRQLVGYRLLKELLACGEKINLMSFTLEVREKNQGAILLYEKLGFHWEGTRKDFYENPKENALIMWKYPIL